MIQRGIAWSLHYFYVFSHDRQVRPCACKRAIHNALSMQKKYLYILLAVLLVAAMSYFLTREEKPKISALTASASSAAMEVDAIVVQPGSFSNVISLSGSIEPNEQVQIRSEVSGIVRSLSFQEGSNVQKGQLLFRIDDTELQAQLSQANTQEKLAADNENRARLLLEKEAISVQEYDVALADYESSKAQSALIRAQIEKTYIRAPFSGKIGLRSISEGEYLTPATVVANLMSVNPVKIQFAVPERYSGQIRLKQGFEFQVSGSAARYHAEVYAIEPGVDPTTRTISIRAIAENPNGVIFPGSFAHIEFPLHQVEDAILIPSQAVIPVQNGKQVFVYRNNVATAVPVDAENRTATDVLINTGLAVGDTVLVSGILSLRDGDSVRVNIIEQQND